MKSLTEHLWLEVLSRRGFVNITGTVESLAARSGVREGLLFSRLKKKDKEKDKDVLALECGEAQQVLCRHQQGPPVRPMRGGDSGEVHLEVAHQPLDHLAA